MMEPETIQKVVGVLSEACIMATQGTSETMLASYCHDEGNFAIMYRGDQKWTASEEYAAGLLARDDRVRFVAEQLRELLPAEAVTTSRGLSSIGTHFQNVCRCGVVVSQCRCPGPKVTNVVQEECPACADVRKVASDTCDRPPAGWSCSREPGHEGPCAALPVHQGGPDNEPYDKQISRLADFIMEKFPDEIGRGYPNGMNTGSEGAIDVAIRLLNGGANPRPQPPADLAPPREVSV